MVAKREFEVELSVEAVDEDEMTRMIIVALFAKGPSEVAKDFLSWQVQRAREVVG